MNKTNIDIDNILIDLSPESTRYCDPMLFLTEVFNARGVECNINIDLDDNIIIKFIGGVVK